MIKKCVMTNDDTFPLPLPPTFFSSNSDLINIQLSILLLVSARHSPARGRQVIEDYLSEVKRLIGTRMLHFHSIPSRHIPAILSLYKIGVPLSFHLSLLLY